MKGVNRAEEAGVMGSGVIGNANSLCKMLYKIINSSISLAPVKSTNATFSLCSI